MAKVEVKATELVDTEVEFISLVKRGANRIPFRICKKDEHDMINLSRVFRKADLSPSVISAVVRKGADLDVQKDRLVKAGLSVDKMVEADGVYVFQQGIEEGQDEAVLKVDEDLALVVTGLAKAFNDMNLESSSFADVFATEAYRPSVRMALDMLSNTISNVLAKAESTARARDDISKAIDEFKDYVVSLTGAIPVTAFKADVVKGEKPPVEKAEEAPSSEEGKSEAPAVAEKSEDTGEETHAAEDQAEPAAKSEASESAEAKKSEEAKTDTGSEEPAPAGDVDVMAKVEALVSDLAKSIEALSSSLGQKVDDLATRTAAAEARAQKAEEAVNGTVSVTHKSDRSGTSGGQSEGLPPLLDTAFNRPN